MHYDWNPFKIDDAESLRHHKKAWNFDQRNESYYLGKINEAGESDLKMRYFTDGKSSRYYRKGEIIRQEENLEVKEPFRNNSNEGKRTRNFSFKLSAGEKKKDSRTGIRNYLFVC
jgi:CRISPR/Cas system CMR-associated protein Cmr5 small subunit